MTSASKSLLLLSWNYPPRRGGIEEMVRRLFAQLSARGQVLLFTGRGPESGSDPPGVLRAPFPGFAGFLIWLLLRLPIELWRNPEATVLSSGALVGSLVELWARLLGLPHAVLVYGTDLTYRSWLYQLWLRRSLRTIPAFFAISGAVERELDARGVASERIRRLSPGVDPSIADAPYDPGLAAPGVPVLLFVGRVIERKGLEPFIRECLPRILARRQVELWVVGGDPVGSLAHEGGALSRIRAQLASSGLVERVRLLGAVSDERLRAAYRAASILILPSVHVPGDLEGFGLVFLEAAMFGVPAVSTKLGGIPDAVVDEVTGLLVEPGDWSAFSEAVLVLLEDDGLRRALGRAAQLRARRDHEWPRVASRCCALLEEVRRA